MKMDKIEGPDFILSENKDTNGLQNKEKKNDNTIHSTCIVAQTHLTKKGLKWTVDSLDNVLNIAKMD